MMAEITGRVGEELVSKLLPDKIFVYPEFLFHTF